MGNRHEKQKFNSRDIQILVDLSGKSENEIRQWYDEFHQATNGTDQMTKQQFELFYTKLKKNPKLELITDYIFRAFDTDHSGKLDFKEFLIAYIVTSTGTNRQKFEYAFEVYDINENHKIEKKEAKKILNIICQILGFSDDDAKAYTTTVMLTFDVNEDKCLSKEEFIHGCLNDPTLGDIINPFSLY